MEAQEERKSYYSGENQGVGVGVKKNKSRSDCCWLQIGGKIEETPTDKRGLFVTVTAHIFTYPISKGIRKPRCSLFPPSFSTQEQFFLSFKFGLLLDRRRTSGRLPTCADSPRATHMRVNFTYSPSVFIPTRRVFQTRPTQLIINKPPWAFITAAVSQSTSRQPFPPSFYTFTARKSKIYRTQVLIFIAAYH